MLHREHDKWQRKQYPAHQLGPCTELSSQVHTRNHERRAGDADEFSGTGPRSWIMDIRGEATPVNDLNAEQQDDSEPRRDNSGLRPCRDAEARHQQDRTHDPCPSGVSNDPRRADPTARDSVENVLDGECQERGGVEVAAYFGEHCGWQV